MAKSRLSNVHAHTHTLHSNHHHLAYKQDGREKQKRCKGQNEPKTLFDTVIGVKKKRWHELNEYVDVFYEF